MVVYPMTLAGSGLEYQPAFHIYYEERVMDMADGLKKFATMPEAFGGSGELVEEPAASGWTGTGLGRRQRMRSFCDALKSAVFGPFETV